VNTSWKLRDLQAEAVRAALLRKISFGAQKKEFSKGRPRLFDERKKDSEFFLNSCLACLIPIHIFWEVFEEKK
jgi:hypothetical protein